VQEQHLQVVLRCAGGWVRDKLLNLQSNDIDIAIDTMNGEGFVQQINGYLERQGEKLKHLGVLKLNPDKSKHLETAVCRIKGFEVDFVNLRGETYTETSRIPTMVLSPTS